MPAWTNFGGFDHNAQALALVTRLEHRYAAFDGLNLTWETLEGLVKHNGPLIGAGREAAAGSHRRVRRAMGPGAWRARPGSRPRSRRSADDIAYVNHDIDDGLRAGLFAVDELFAVPLAGPVFRDGRSPPAGWSSAA